MTRLPLWHRHAAFGTAAVAREGFGFLPRAQIVRPAPARGKGSAVTILPDKLPGTVAATFLAAVREIA